MKSLNLTRWSRTLGLTALSLLAASALQAQNPVSFSIDLSAESLSDVTLKGSFDGWGGGLALTNDGAGIWSGTLDIAGTAGDVIACKYLKNPGGAWEDDPNRQFQLAGGAQTLPLTGWNDQYGPTNMVTFQVDMSQQIALGNFVPGQPIRVTGNFKNPRWDDGIDLTNNPALSGMESNIYSMPTPVVGILNGLAREYKFRANGGWEGIPNRTFVITNSDQVLPLSFYDNVPFGAPTNAVTVRIDMTAKVLTGAFTNNGGIIRVSGDFTGWGDGADLTNNLALSGNASNVYSMVFQIIGFPGEQHYYKFRMNNGWESPTTGVPPDNNRVFALAGGDQVLPLVTYSDDSLCDLLLADTDVTFTLQITNGTPDRNGVPFVKGTDRIFINGQFAGWLDGFGNWNDGIVNPFDDPNVINAFGDLQLTNNPIGSDTYQQTLKFKAGLPVSTVYKFSLNGFDNELGFGVNHLKFVRTTTTSYNMPTSHFGTNYLAELSEVSFGNLTIAPAVGGVVPVNWLGRQCVTLQTKDTITGSWTDLPATDAKNSTNYPNGGGNQFFRLQKRANP